MIKTVDNTQRPTENKTPYTILLTGGGTGGHITPLLAVAYELKQLHPTCRIIYVGERGGKFTQLTDGHHAIDETYTIYAGKFRRYYGDSWMRRLLDVKTNLLNIRDMFFILIGTMQSLRLVARLNPDVILLKGGFVGVPVGMAAAIKHKPFLTHDSDAVRGLANRLVSRWARLHATAMPPEYYSYPREKICQVGVLVEHTYQPVTPALQKQYKERLGLPQDTPLLLVTGGSSGAERINEAIVKGVDGLLVQNPTLRIVHQVGKGKGGVYGEYSHERLQIEEFLQPMYVFMGAADLVVARASGNTIAELGVQGKACIVVPNPHLAGGHQLKNAERLAEQGGAVVVSEKELYDQQQGLIATVSALLSNPKRREELAHTLQAVTIPDATHKLAKLILDVGH